MYLWMSTGLPFNATFNYMRRVTVDAPSQTPDDSMDPLDMPQGSTAPQRTARHGYVVKFLSFPVLLHAIMIIVKVIALLHVFDSRQFCIVICDQ